MSYVAIGGATISLVGGLISGGKAKKAARAAAAQKQKLSLELNALENSRQDIINPWADSKDLSSMGKNAFANLSVATQAAEMQAEEADISLANTLDAIRSSGASAGGATALAQAALQSKKGISASIEQQEATNEKMKAEGEQALNQFKISESQRMQSVVAQGKEFVYGQTENRQMQKMNRVQSQIDNAGAQEMQQNQNANAAYSSALGAVGNVATAAAGATRSAKATPGTTAGTTATSSATASSFNPTPLDTSAAAGGGFLTQDFSGSDRRLKNNIVKIGKSPSGLNIYSFEYKDTKFGDGLWQGVMSDEVPSEAVSVGADGYDRVNYSLLDVEFKQI